MNDLTQTLESKAGCIASAMQVIGSKWTALILRDLASGPIGFCELQKAVGDINPRTLSQRLDDLENHGIVRRDERGTRPVYSLTDKGTDLIPVLRQMAAWGNKYYTEERTC